MDVYEALYTTRMMRRMRTDPVPVQVQERILDATIRAPNGGNAQRWHFMYVDDPGIKAQLAPLYNESRQLEYVDLVAGRLGRTFVDPAKHAETMRKIKIAGEHFVEHFTDIPLLMFCFYLDDQNGSNIYPAVWSAMLAARAEGVGGVFTTALRYKADEVHELLGVPTEEGWRMNAMLAFGYPSGEFGVAVDREPAHTVSSRNGWGKPLGSTIPAPLWPAAGADA